MSSMAKIDLKKVFKEFYNPPVKEAVIVDIPLMNYLMIDGMGDPATSKEYHESIEALYNVAYTLKFMLKNKGKTADYIVPPLEGLWWADDMNAFTLGNREQWKWTSMIMQPEFITRELVEEALEQVRKKKDLPSLSKIKFESLHEGLSAQIMHIGPYSAEGPTIEKLHNFVKENGYVLRGKHHEIYMSDPRKVAPEKLKTVIRQPIISGQ